jgi:hypothetical protein
MGAGMSRMRGRRLVDWREMAIALALLGAILVVVSVVLATCANAGECLTQRQALAQAQVKGYARRGMNNCWHVSPTREPSTHEHFESSFDGEPPLVWGEPPAASFGERWDELKMWRRQSPEGQKTK